MSYWTYYLFWLLLAYGIRQPWLLGGVILFLVLRRWIPDPAAVLRAIRRGQTLRAQVSMNAANATARRDLATMYLDLLRPRRALVLVDEALARDPDSAVCPTRILERRPGKLRAEAVFHEDVNDPGDASLVEMQFEKVNDQYRFGIFELGRSDEPTPADWLSLRRVPP